ncbi:hypothetical protein L873DRAFT_1006290 [Choiromyces venosus 120613-1]|uniref:Pentacotripeptide-repeat region of PRORP domain-containing protein n=1 Tax=Choiromyces venosus 120613-1 TaxID=1336337 RepID=A0A3N4JRB8_9PEZI|nr:hypothetical protein L873DRAFT_1006290 [Choiromyces venosus 120613-1]
MKIISTEISSAIYEDRTTTTTTSTMLNCHACWRQNLAALISTHVPRRTAYASAVRVREQRFNGRNSALYRDPHKLANAVKKQLMQGDDNKALQMAREGSRTLNSVVSWNHIIGHNIERGHLRVAFKAFNDMKKMSIFPDTYTFTIMLNALAEHANRPSAHERALQLYSSMSNPNSPVEPQIVHTNAVLKVCARCRDIDSIWTIVSKLPLSGLNAPNAITYTTLLNGIHGANEVEDGRRVWAGILSRWGTGKLWVDEQLVCAMGRVLLSSAKPEHRKEVFKVIEQVFGIENPISEKEEVNPEDQLYVGGTTKPITEIKELLQTSGEGDPNTPIPYVPLPLRGQTTRDSPTSGSNSPATRPMPGNSVLGLAIQACAKLENKDLGRHYWKTLTAAPYSVRPDTENYHELLRLLRESRSGPEALDVLHAMLSHRNTTPTPKSFFIAMSCCKREGRGPGFPTANKMLTLMSENNVRIDVKIVTSFLQCAVKTGIPAYWKSALKTAEDIFDLSGELDKLVRKKADGEVIERHVELGKWMQGIIHRLLESTEVSWGHGERVVFERKKGKLVRLIEKFGWLAGGAEGVGKKWKAKIMDGNIE